MNLWLVLIAGGLLTYGIRLSFIAMVSQTRMPKWMRSSLRFVPPAVLSALVFPELLLHSGSFDLSMSNSRLIAGVLASIVAWRTRHALLTIVVGMVALLVLEAIRLA